MNAHPTRASSWGCAPTTRRCAPSARVFISPRIAVLAASFVACTIVVPTAGLISEGTPNAPDAGDGPADGGAADAATVVTDPDLLAYWSFQEVSPSIAADHSGHDHPLTVVGATVTPSGPHGSALQLDGGGYAETKVLDDAAFPRSGTFSLWLKWTHPPNETTTDRGVFDDYDPPRMHLFLRHPNGTTGDRFQIGAQVPNSTQYAFVHDFSLSRDTWHMITFTWDAEEKHSRLYIDHALTRDETYRVTTFVPTAQRSRIGQHFLGEIDEVRLYARALGPMEVSALP